MKRIIALCCLIVALCFTGLSLFEEVASVVEPPDQSMILTDEQIDQIINGDFNPNAGICNPEWFTDVNLIPPTVEADGACDDILCMEWCNSVATILIARRCDRMDYPWSDLCRNCIYQEKLQCHLNCLINNCSSPYLLDWDCFSGVG